MAPIRMQCKAGAGSNFAAFAKLRVECAHKLRHGKGGQFYSEWRTETHEEPSLQPEVQGGGGAADASRREPFGLGQGFAVTPKAALPVARSRIGRQASALRGPTKEGAGSRVWP